MDAVQKAESGHPGTPMGLADLAVVLWTEFLNHDPDHPDWPDRDRFVLSAGHASMLLYSLLHLSGYDLPLEELKEFRQWGSMTPGHPEKHDTPGVETTTGPLGQGITNAIGMALAERHLAARFNEPEFPLVDHYTYTIASDGDLMEGISNEASSLAGHLGLGRLVVFYDDNEISIDGSTDLAFTEDVTTRYDALGWQTQEIDGHDHEEIRAAIERAQADADRPSLIACRTHIGFGSPNQQDTAAAHGSPLGEEEIELTKDALDWPTEPLFHVPDDVKEFMENATGRGRTARKRWADLAEAYAEAHPERAAEWERFWSGELEDGWDAELDELSFDGPIATRAASGQTLGAIKDRIPNLLGGSADLTGSNKTKVGDEPIVSAENYGARYIHFGVREHAMGGMMNGMALHGGVRPYGGTFLIFSDYQRPSVRLAALMELPVVFVYTHDSVGLGEDGPTHQPIEHLASLRAMPNMTVLRPSDANEVKEAWRFAVQHDGPVSLVLTRQGLPVFDREQYGGAEGVHRGGYVLAEPPGGVDPEAILMATGSEVWIALEAREKLAEEGTAARVVALPSWELFEEQSASYREKVLPPEVRARVAIEAASPFGWERYVGSEGTVIGLDRYGASAPYPEIYEQLGLTSDRVAEAARSLVIDGG